MRLDANDRSRLVFACLITAVALPAIWWANEGEADIGRPNVAAAGLPAEAAAPAATAPTAPAIADPVYLTPASTLPAPGEATPVVQIGDPDHRALAEVTGTYRRSVAPGTCEVSGIDAAGTITVYNPANGQSVDCRPVRVQGAEPTVVLSAAEFGALADFTDAPITVEIRE